MKYVTKPFELVHSDLKSFPVESYHKFKYAIIFYDDYTSMDWVLGIHSKDQALLAVKAFLKYIQVQYQLEVKGWMSDQGGEYKSKAFEQLMHDNGIHVYDSVLHTPQQNGHAEQFIRTIMDKAQAMCLHASLPDFYWEFAILHAAHIYNCTPKQGLSWKTPYELLYKKPPTISHLQVFRCGAYVHLPAETCHDKLDPKSQLMIYLGIAPGNELNSIFMCPNNSLHTSAHAIFNENLFSCCSGARPHKPISNKPSHSHQHPPKETPASNDDLNDFPHSSRTCEKIKIPEQAPSPDSELEPEREPSPTPPPPPPVTPPRHTLQLDAPPALPRCSERICHPPLQPGNIFGEWEQPIK